MNKIDFTLVELLNALYVAECIIKGHPSISNVEKDLIFKSFSDKKGK